MVFLQPSPAMPLFPHGQAVPLPSPEQIVMPFEVSHSSGDEVGVEVQAGAEEHVAIMGAPLLLQ